LTAAIFSVRSAQAPVRWRRLAPWCRALVSEAQADSENNDEKRKARYQADSADVQAFYRVNNYPK